MKTITEQKPKLSEKNTEIYNLLVKLNMSKSQVLEFIKQNTEKEKKKKSIPTKRTQLPEYKLVFETTCETCGAVKREMFCMLRGVKYSLENGNVHLHNNLPIKKEKRTVPICIYCEMNLNMFPRHQVVQEYLKYIRKNLTIQRKKR